MEYQILHWIKHTPIGDAARDTSWLFPACQCIHLSAICLLFVALLAMDLRLLGFAREIPLKVLNPLAVLAGCAFVVILITGYTMVSAFPENYWPNWIFKVKVALILLAVANAGWFVLGEHRQLTGLGAGAQVSRRIKILALASLTLWTSILIVGRLLSFLATHTTD